MEFKLYRSKGQHVVEITRKHGFEMIFCADLDEALNEIKRAMEEGND